ncbi:MAG: hypothetical protein WC807_09165 [Hyphomicrobium sp.]|jgi:hypothetical protein|uniref:hypothetical protein n=1 Tax=Hyphomicrobium sp. DMF-1 TaxID=3019544 RepID=UPI0022EBD5A3|nr:hypothetical protein [Hyphomicrobium sp. DMF-1]WBT37946.1 hypothetical protein PE058_20160 [Hyphomicrobium sp. DMF-1]
MPRSTLTASLLAVALAVSGPALAQKAGQHGGQTAVVAGHHDAELVIEPTRLVLYLTNHGKPLSAKDNTIKATVQDAGTKSEIKLTVEGDHLVGPLSTPLNKGAIVLLSGKTEDGHGVSARFTVR